MEMTEWIAYENAYGPINGHWQNETLAQMHELLQSLMYIQGSSEENQMPKPTTKARPGAAYGFERDEYGQYTVQPEEVKEAIAEAESDGGAAALNAFFDSQVEEEG